MEDFVLKINIDKDNQVNAMFKGKDVSNRYTLDTFFDIIATNKDYYKRAGILDTEDNIRYYFVSEKENNSICVDVAQELETEKTDEFLEEKTSIKDRLENLVQEANERKEQRTKTAKKEETRKKWKTAAKIFASGAVIITVIGGSVFLTDLGIECLKQDMELQKQGIYTDVASDTFYSSAPIEFVRENDEKFQRQMQESKEQERKEEEAMVRAASDTDSMQESQAKGK